MAPIRPTRKPLSTSLSTSLSSLSLPPKTPPNPKAPLKRQKRLSKHTTLLTRIAKTAPAPSKAPKRRRPSKKLVANLGSLADALPSVIGNADDGDAWEGIADDNDGNGNGNKCNSRGVRIRHKSLKSRPGAGRKKERVVAMERERFARNLARMAAGRDGGVGGGGGGEEEGAGKGRWAAIRGFIEETMERRPEGEGGDVKR